MPYPLLGVLFHWLLSANVACLVSHERDIRREQCQIRLNLVIAIAVAQIIFLAGIDATSRQVTIFNKPITAELHMLKIRLLSERCFEDKKFGRY